MRRLIGIVLFAVAIAAVASNAQWRSAAIMQLRALAEPLFDHGQATEPQFDRFYVAMVEELPSQLRAERALELTINRYLGAAEYVIDNAQNWRGQFAPSERLTALITTAINAPLMEIRMAGFELHLAQYDLEKSLAEIERLAERLHADPRGSGPWALWSMALIGARGVERESVYETLLHATEHEDDYVRRWAVDALAKFGGAEVIEPLLAIAVEDSSPVVRERAFCGLAQSGTLHVAERYAALAGLLNIVDRPEASKQTLDWGYQALREITNLYDLPENSQLWRQRLTVLEML